MVTTSQRLRITFSKGAAIQYTSHLDLQAIWVRALRRAGAPLVYSQGFNPRPRLQLAAALALGHSSDAELLDVWLVHPVDVGDFCRALGGALPAGLEVVEVREAALDEPALQTRVRAAEYAVTVAWDEPAPSVEARLLQVLAAPELVQERRGGKYDLRPLIERLWLEQADGSVVVLGMQLAARAGETARPEAVLEVLGMAGAFARYHRRRLQID